MVPKGMIPSVVALVDGPLLSRKFAVVRTVVPGAKPPGMTVGVMVACADVGVRVGVGVLVAVGVRVAVVITSGVSVMFSDWMNDPATHPAGNPSICTGYQV